MELVPPVASTSPELPKKKKKNSNNFQNEHDRAPGDILDRYFMFSDAEQNLSSI